MKDCHHLSSFLAEKKKKRFVSGQATTKLGNPYKSLREKNLFGDNFDLFDKLWAAHTNLCLMLAQFWFVGDIFDLLVAHFVQLIPIYVWCWSNFDLLFQMHFPRISITVLVAMWCHAEKYCTNRDQSASDKFIFHQISSTNSWNWIYQPQKDVLLDQERCQQVLIHQVSWLS